MTLRPTNRFPLQFIARLGLAHPGLEARISQLGLGLGAKAHWRPFSQTAKAKQETCFSNAAMFCKCGHVTMAMKPSHPAIANNRTALKADLFVVFSLFCAGPTMAIITSCRPGRVRLMNLLMWQR